MSPGALYRYFRSKDEIIDAIGEEQRERNLAIIHRRPPVGRFVDHLVLLGLDFLREMTGPGRAALMAEVFAESLRNPAACTRFKVNAEDCGAIIGAMISDAVKAGEIEPPEDIGFAISALMSTAEGLVMRMSFDPTLTVERVEPLMRIVTEGLFPPRRPV